MHRFFTFLICLLFSSAIVYSQKKELKVKFGKISDKEMAMTSYEQDPAAPGIVLFDIGTVTNDYTQGLGFSMVFERHLRFKVFKKDALDLANFVILHHKDSKISDIKAISFNLEGGGQVVETKLEKDNIYVEEITQTRRMTKFIVPAVKEGSIVDVKYSWRTSKGINIPNWQFQREHVPTIWSEFKAEVPTFIEFKKLSQGWEPFSLAEEETRTGKVNGNIDYYINSIHYIQENVPALKTENYVYSPNDYLSGISFDVHTIYDIDVIPSGPSYRVVNGMPTPFPNTWRALGKELMDENYGKDLESGKFTEEMAKSCVEGKTTISEKTSAIYAHIGNNFHLKEDHDRIFKSQNLGELTKERNGTPTDLNLLFINMLRRVEVMAFPVLISTTDHGKLYDFRVSLDHVNRVITAVQMEDSTLLLVDAAAYPNPVGLLRTEDLGNQGLLLRSEKDNEWVGIQNKVAEKSVVIANLSIDAEGKSNGSVTAYESGYGGVDMRKAINAQGDQTAVKSKFQAWLADGGLSELKLTNHDKWNESSVKMEFKMSSSAFCNVSGDKIYLSPMVGLGIHENPFKNPERKFNIEFGPTGEAQYILSFTLPAGYKVEEMPKSTKTTFGENAMAYEYLTESNGATIKFTVRFKRKTDTVDVAEYAMLQQFFADMATKLEEQVVLTKI